MSTESKPIDLAAAAKMAGCTQASVHAFTEYDDHVNVLICTPVKRDKDGNYVSGGKTERKTIQKK